MSQCEPYELCSSLTEWIGYVYVIPAICAAGVCFNVVVLIIFLKPSFRSQMTSSTLTYLLGLAIADLLTALLILPLGFVRCIDATTTEIQFVFNFYEKYIHMPVANIFMTLSVWTTVTITTERFLFLHGNGGEVSGQSMSRSAASAKLIVLSLFVVAVGFNVPMFLYYDSFSGDEPVERSDFAKTAGFEVYFWIRMFVVKIIPIVIIIILNAALLRLMRRNSQGFKVTTGAVQDWENKRAHPNLKGHEATETNSS